MTLPNWDALNVLIVFLSHITPLVQTSQLMPVERQKFLNFYTAQSGRKWDEHDEFSAWVTQ